MPLWNSIRNKILIIFMVTLGLMAAGTAYGLIKLKHITNETAQITDKNIPLIEVLTQISIGQRNQTIAYERAIGAMNGAMNKKSSFDHERLFEARQDFEGNEVTIDLAFEQGHALLNSGNANIFDKQYRFNEFKKTFERHRIEHNQFRDSARNIFLNYQDWNLDIILQKTQIGRAHV